MLAKALALASCSLMERLETVVWFSETFVVSRGAAANNWSAARSNDCSWISTVGDFALVFFASLDVAFFIWLGLVCL